MICLQSSQRILQLTHRFVPVTTMSANLSHQKNLVATVRDSFAHELFAASIMIFPGIVHKGDAQVDRFLDQPDRFFFIFNCTEVVPTQTNRGNLNSRLTKRSGNSVRQGAQRGNLVERRVHIQ